MKPIRQILALTDFSVPAQQAAERAALLASSCQAALTLLHVLPVEPLRQLRAWLPAPAPVEGQLQAAAVGQLARVAAGLQALHGLQGLPLHTRCADGPVVEEITAAADALDAGLLVLGARGAGIWRRLVLGTTAERLLRRTQRPLLVVRAPAAAPYGRVLVALDFSPWSLAALALAQAVAPAAQWVLFHAFQVPFEDKLHFAGVDASTVERYRQQSRALATQRVHALAAAVGLEAGHWQPCVVEGEAALRLLEQEQQQGCDLVVLGKHGQSATEDLLLGSVSRLVLAEGRGDVLVSTAQAATPAS